MGYNAREVDNCIEILSKGNYENSKQVVGILLQNEWYTKSENIPVIIKLVNDDKWPTRLCTLASIPNDFFFHYEELFSLLKKSLTDPSYRVQRFALDVIRADLGYPFIEGEKGKVKMIEPIIPVLIQILESDDENYRIQSTVAGLLARIAYNEPTQFIKYKDELVRYYQKTNDSNIPHFMQYTEYAELFNIERADNNEPIQIQMNPQLLKLLDKFKGNKEREKRKKNEAKVVEYLIKNPDQIYDFIAFYLQDVVGNPPGRHMIFDELLGGSGYNIIKEVVPLIELNDNVYTLIVETFSNPDNIDRVRMRAASTFAEIGLLSRSRFYEHINNLITSDNYVVLKATLVAIHVYSKSELVEKKTLYKLLDRLFDNDKQFLGHLLFIISFTFQDNIKVPSKYEERLIFIHNNIASFGNTWIHEESWKENSIICISLLDITDKSKQDRIVKLCMEHVTSNVYPAVTFQCFENLAGQIDSFDNEVIEFLLLELVKRTKIGDKQNAGQIRKILKENELSNREIVISVYQKHSNSDDKWLNRYCQRKLQKF